MKNIKEFLKNDRFAASLGIEILEAGNGKAKVKLEISDKHLNALDIVHGGAIFTLADFALAAASNSPVTTAVALNSGISFLKSALPDDILYAEAYETSANGKIASYAVDVRNDHGELIASSQCLVYRKKGTTGSFSTSPSSPATSE